VYKRQEGARLLEVGLGLAREPDDDVRRECHRRLGGAQRVDDLKVARARVGPLHRAQDAVAARLDGKVHVLAQLREPAERAGQVLPEPARVRRGEADPLQAGDRMDPLEQLDEGGDARGMGVVAPAVARDDLPEEGDLAGAPRDEPLAFAHDVVHRAGPLVAPRRRDDAERAVHVASLLDRDERAHLRLSLIHI